MADDPWAEADLPAGDDTAPRRAPTGPRARIRRKLRRWEPPKGNVKTGDLAAARTSNIERATMKARPEPDEWREQLAAGDRSKAISSLASPKLTHNSGSGFGLA